MLSKRLNLQYNLKAMKKLLPALLLLLFTITACKKEAGTSPSGADTTGRTQPPISGKDASALSVSPASGQAGTWVIVYGSGFGSGMSGISVFFNGVAGSIRSVKDTEIEVNVPATASTGKISITLGNRTIIGPDFTVGPSTAVTGLSPASGPAGTSVTITGTNFVNVAGDLHVLFNGVQATVGAVSPTEIKVTAPNATSGQVTVFIAGQMIPGPVFSYPSVLNTPYAAGDVSLRSQADVNAFAAQNKGRVLTISGSLSVSGADITSVVDLSLIRSVSGSVNISNCPSLSDLAFLNGLTGLGALNLQGLPVTTIRLDQLTSVSGPIQIVGCGNLTNASFRALTSIGGNLLAGSMRISGCPKLTDVDCSALVSADSFIYFGLTGISDFRKFNNLRTAGSLELSGNTSLTSLHGLEQLTTLTAKGVGVVFTTVTIHGLNIAGNPKLNSLDGLQHLTSTPIVTIKGNPALTEFCPLKALLNTLKDQPDLTYSPTSQIGRTAHLPAVTLTGNSTYATTPDALNSLATCP